MDGAHLHDSEGIVEQLSALWALTEMLQDLFRSVLYSFLMLSSHIVSDVAVLRMVPDAT